MKEVILFIWQLPQNILGLLVIIFSRAWKAVTYETVWWTKRRFGVSLGNYIILYEDSKPLTQSVKHEKGHQKQSLYLGWLYLIIIGIPSAFGNLWDRVAHKNWKLEEREKWYYSQPWEAWADKLGGVRR